MRPFQDEKRRQVDLRSEVLYPTLAKRPNMESALHKERIPSPNPFMKRSSQGAPGIKHKDRRSRFSSAIVTILVQAQPGQRRTVGKGMKVYIVAGSADQLDLIKG
jgi:hypothetical protein